ncbi:MAG: hypothetical protein AAFR31_15290, partial [Cyanobacteria bacterium J06627_8]
VRKTYFCEVPNLAGFADHSQLADERAPNYMQLTQNIRPGERTADVLGHSALHEFLSHIEPSCTLL